MIGLSIKDTTPKYPSGQIGEPVFESFLADYWIFVCQLQQRQEMENGQ